MLISMLKNVVTNRVLHPFKLADAGPLISHLMFVDDLLITLTATKSNTIALLILLKEYSLSNLLKIAKTVNSNQNILYRGSNVNLMVSFRIIIGTFINNCV